MKKVLVVHYHFLPVHNVGVKQLLGYCKYLPEFGWEPHVLTREWRESLSPEDAGWGLSYEAQMEKELTTLPRIHRSAYHSYDGAILRAHEWLSGAGGSGGMRKALFLPVRKLLSLFTPLFGRYPDRLVGWVPEAVALGEKVAREEKIDALFSLCPPETNHLVASRLARRLRLPWLAFFGDLYGFYFGRHDWHRTPWHRWLNLRLHRRWLRPAKRVQAVSPYMVEYLEKQFRKRGELVVVGFDEAEFPPSPPAQNPRLRLSYVGSIYPGDQRPEILLDALDELIHRQPAAAREVEVFFVGTKQEAWLEELCGNRPARAIVSIRGKVSPAEAIALQRQSDALLLLNTTLGRESHGTLSYPSKIFEYFAAARPILALPRDRDWGDKMLDLTKAGTAVDTSGEAAAVLERWYLEWKERGHLSYPGKSTEISRFSQREQARRIAASLDTIVCSKHRN